MSAAAASAPTNSCKNVRDADDALVDEAPPAKKATTTTDACKCDRCDLRSQIQYLLAETLRVVDERATEPDPSTASEEKRCRAMRSNIGVSTAGVIRLVNELLPTDERRQTRPALSGRDFRSLYARKDFTHLSTACNVDSDSDDDDDKGRRTKLSSGEMFQRYRSLVRTHLAMAQRSIANASDATFDVTLIEYGTMAHIIAFSCAGFGCCRRAFQELRDLATQLERAVGNLADCPEIPDCVMRRSPRPFSPLPEDSDTDVDTVPEEAAPAAAAFELQNASQDPRAEFN